jgi:hypothetical protein
MERRYSDNEIREIMERAAHEDATPSATDLPATRGAGQGLTLSDLQAIGREVGLDPDRIAEAARGLELRRNVAADRSLLGLPIGVGRAVDLPRQLTDDEWSILVSEIRETFGARGRLGGQGAMREWSNGWLHVAQEATEAGYRLRLHTRKENGMIADRIGTIMLTMAVILFAVFALTGSLGGELFAPFFLGAGGVAAFAYNLLVLPRWSAERAAQMEHIAARALELTGRDETE